MNNHGLIHQHCVDARKRHWQEHNKDTVVQIGDFCKIAFGKDKETEHMFVEVAAIDGKKYIGILANDPVIQKHLNYGDTVSFVFSDIEQLISDANRNTRL